MPQRGRPPAASQEESPSGKPNLLARSVEQLNGELRGFREVLEEIREEFLWVTRSGGVAARRVEFVRVKRMALDPCAEDWGEKLDLERAMYDPSGRVSPLESQLIERVVEDLETVFETVAEGQLERVLIALDVVRAELVKVMMKQSGGNGWEPREEGTQLRSEVPILTGQFEPVGNHESKPVDELKGRKPSAEKFSAKGSKRRKSEVIAKSATVSSEKLPTQHESSDSPPVQRESRDEPPVEQTFLPPSSEVEIEHQASGLECLPQPELDSAASRKADHETWCREVRDPAIEHSEGRRTIRTARDEARFEYEIAPLPHGKWAVNWQYGFLCGNRDGSSHPWTQFGTRDECLQQLLMYARQFFTAPATDAVQQDPRREMQRLLGAGLFGFFEPEPVRQDPGQKVNPPKKTR